MRALLGRLGMARIATICLSILVLASNAVAQEKKVFEIVSHYDYAPYVTGPEQGLTVELARYLTEKSNGRYLFKVSVLPKPRLLKKALQNEWVGIIPWVIPVWMREIPSERFLWSEPILDEGEQVLSRKSAAIEWKGSVSLHNKKFGALLGHIYVDLEKDMDLGKIQREDAPTSQSNLNKLRAGRVDAIFLSNLTVDYIISTQPQLFDGLYISEAWRFPKKQEVRLFFKLNDPVAHDWLLQEAKKMPTDPDWKNILQRFGLKYR